MLNSMRFCTKRQARCIWRGGRERAITRDRPDRVASLLGNLSGERLVPPFTVSDFTQRFPLLPALAESCDRIANLMDKWFRNGFILKLADCQDGANNIKYLHEVPLFLTLTVALLLLMHPTISLPGARCSGVWDNSTMLIHYGFSISPFGNSDAVYEPLICFTEAFFSSKYGHDSA